MANSRNDVYFVLKDEQGEELLCPLNEIRNRNAVTEKERLNCFEKEVAERYSGNIIIN